MNKARKRIHGTTRRQPIELFDKFEKSTLTVLPLSRFETAVWKELKIQRDIHIQFDKAYYSVPYEFIGKKVFARKTDSQVAIFYDNKLIAVHLPVKPGKRSTKFEHYPSGKYGYIRMNSNFCMDEAEKIGTNTYAMIDRLLNEEPLRDLRSAQNIIRLKKKYPTDRIEAACQRSINFNNYPYSSIKNILELKIENRSELTKEIQPKKLCSRYARDIKELLKLQEVSYAKHGSN